MIAGMTPCRSLSHFPSNRYNANASLSSQLVSTPLFRLNTTLDGFDRSKGLEQNPEVKIHETGSLFPWNAHRVGARRGRGSPPNPGRPVPSRATGRSPASPFRGRDHGPRGSPEGPDHCRQLRGPCQRNREGGSARPGLCQRFAPGGYRARRLDPLRSGREAHRLRSGTRGGDRQTGLQSPGSGTP